MFIEWVHAHRDFPECWIAWESKIWNTHMLTVEERIRWEWGECCWTAKILSEGEVAGIYLRRMMEAA